MRHLFTTVTLGCLCTGLLMPRGWASEGPDAKRLQKPGVDAALGLLSEGNARFCSGTATYPHTDADRVALSGGANQADYAYATVVSCSDSRVPVELIFDAGVMDLFIIRIAGNVCDTDEIGSIEYGLAHVNTPLLVVMGHTQCGAVTAVTQALHGKGHALERNIPPLVDNIKPAVERVMAGHDGMAMADVIPLAIEENVWQGIEDVFMASPATRALVAEGKVKVVGAIYNVGTGRVRWLADSKVAEIFQKVAEAPDRAVEPMAGH